MTQRIVFDDFGLEPIGTDASDKLSPHDIDVKVVGLDDLPMEVREDKCQIQFSNVEFVSLKEVKSSSPQSILITLFSRLAQAQLVSITSYSRKLSLLDGTTRLCRYRARH